MSDGLHPQREVAAASPERRSCGPAARWSFLFASLLGAFGAFPAEEPTESANTRLQEVVVEAKRAADEEVTRRVEKTLTNDPWVLAEHVTITTRNGVVRVEGIVQDTGELFRILDLARKTPGARRVVDALEILHNDPDGG